METQSPAVYALLKLHAELGGKISDNKRQAAKLRADMKHVEAVIHLRAPRRMPFMARGESDSFWGWVVNAGVGPWGSWDFLI